MNRNWIGLEESFAIKRTLNHLWKFEIDRSFIPDRKKVATILCDSFFSPFRTPLQHVGN